MAVSLSGTSWHGGGEERERGWVLPWHLPSVHE